MSLIEDTRKFQKFGGLNPEFAERARQKNKERKIVEKFERQKRHAQRRYEITTEPARRKMEEDIARLSDEAQWRVRAIEIVACVAHHYGVNPSQIIGKTRQRNVIKARFEAMAQIKRARPEMSLTAIGRMFGGRDHSTVIHALRRMGVSTLTGQPV